MVSDAAQLKDEGLRLFQEKRYEEALTQFDQAYHAFSEASQTLDAAEMLNNMGVIHRITGNLNDASKALEQARETFAEAGDKQREAQVLGNLGPLYSKQKEIDKALESYELAISAFRELGDKKSEGETLMAKGILLFKKRRFMDAFAAYDAGILTVPQPTFRHRFMRFLLKLMDTIFKTPTPV